MNRLPLFICLSLFTHLSFGQSKDMAWITSVDQNNVRNSIHTITTSAKVSVDDGSSYTTSSLYQDPQRMAFKLSYPDQDNTMGVEGKYYWQHNGIEEKESSDFVQTFVLGHQFHAHLLFFDKIYESISADPNGSWEESPCTVITGNLNENEWKVFVSGHNILGMILNMPGTAPIKMTFDNWQQKDSVHLPYEITIDDGHRIFNYEYTNIELNRPNWEQLRLNEELLTDEQRLLRMHRIAMDDHLFEKTTGLTSIRADSLVILNRGIVNRIRSKDFDATMEQIMNSRDHNRYDDLIRPIVNISQDGTLGWVIAQVSVEGEVFQYGDEGNIPLSFQSAWIELYEKVDGEWKFIGIVSNFKE